jgi:hypothetical protein
VLQGLDDGFTWGKGNVNLDKDHSDQLWNVFKYKLNNRIGLKDGGQPIFRIWISTPGSMILIAAL